MSDVGGGGGLYSEIQSSLAGGKYFRYSFPR